MIKSVFVGLSLPLDKYKQLSQVGANHLIVAGHSVNEKKWNLLRKTGCDLAISVNAFKQGGCPLEPAAKTELKKHLKNALRWKPKEIWLDHFRFDGCWEAVDIGQDKREYTYKSAHKACRWCKGVRRSEEIAKLARWAKSIVSEQTLVGYFAVPFMLGEHLKLASELGQNHGLLGKIFDLSSPMLYHRMIQKPASYVSEYAGYLYGITKKLVLPIIQIKDMPDDLPDKLSEKEFSKAFNEARKKPSIGVSIFVWEHAVEKNKTGWIKKLFTNI
jgi:hypothetical protein